LTSTRLKVTISEKTRLDKYLAATLPEYSRSKIQDAIKSGYVTVNGAAVKSSRILEGGEEILVSIPDAVKEPNTVEPQKMDLDIVYEDDILAVLNKPVGMVVHPGKGNYSGTLANGLAYHFKTLSDINGSLRPGIVHRLDKNTSGLMIIAKTNLAHHHLAKQFELREIKKTYLGVTWGECDPPAGRIEIGIKRQRSDPTKFEASVDGKPAITDYKSLKSFRYLSLVQFTPLTGRTHQLRVHSSYSGFAIFADDMYNGGVNRSKGFLPEVTKILQRLLKNINRHALHAHQIQFIHPGTDKLLSIEVRIPEDMQNLLAEAAVFNG